MEIFKILVDYVPDDCRECVLCDNYGSEKVSDESKTSFCYACRTWSYGNVPHVRCPLQLR